MALADVLKDHMHWLNRDCAGWESMRANLSWLDLSNAKLDNVDLSSADLSHSCLEGAHLTYACLVKADLHGANLCGARLDEADLREANLKDVDLTRANLRRAQVNGANLSFAKMERVFAERAQFGYTNMRYVNMSEAHCAYASFIDANLRCAWLRDTDLHGAHLDWTVLRGARLCRPNMDDVTGLMMACPSDGAFVGWKKAKSDDDRSVVIKLEIPEDAKRLSGVDRECRCDKAKVLKILDESGEEIDKAYSIYDPDFAYEVGMMVTPDGFEDDRWRWGNGIYFFITRQEAEDFHW